MRIIFLKYTRSPIYGGSIKTPPIYGISFFILGIGPIYGGSAKPSPHILGISLDRWGHL
jgi:hypothetical protein